jgi:hypothetical protein
MQVQMIELEEVMMIETGDDAIEASGKLLFTMPSAVCY